MLVSSSFPCLHINCNYVTYKFQPFPKQDLVFTCLQYKSWENTVETGKHAHNEQFLLFPQCFLPVWRTFCHFCRIWNYRLQTLSVWKSLQFVVGKEFKSMLSASTFKLVQEILALIYLCILFSTTCNSKILMEILLPCWKNELLKTLQEKDKMLATSIFSFSHNVFLPF